MKKLLIITSLIFSTLSFLKSQSNAFSYQAIVRDNSGTLITNSDVSFKISILQTEITNTPVFTETHEASTSSYGSVSLQIGRGTPLLGFLDSLDWKNGPFFIQVSYDITGGSNFELAGTSELLSVPYALYARRSSNVIVGDDGEEYELRVDENGGLYSSKINPDSESGQVQLVVTEMMINPDAIGDQDGEWFELHNYGTDTVDLLGYEISDFGVNTHTISQNVIVEPGAYVVLGRVGNPFLNGGVHVDYVYGSDYTLSNSGDEIVVKDDNGLLVTSLEYTSAFPIESGKSVEFNKALIQTLSDAQMNQDPANWIASTCTLQEGDLGTPGQALNQCLELINFKTVADVNLNTAPADTVAMRGLVISAIQDRNDFDLIWAQDDNLPNSGIRIQVEDASNFTEGDVLVVRGVFSEEQSFSGDAATTSQVSVTNLIEVTGTSSITPVLLDVATTDDAVLDQYLSMLVQFQDVTVGGDAGFGESFIDNQVKIDNYFSDFELGSYSSVSGLVFYSFASYKIEPRSSADLVAN